jgi:hypothetical protein
LHFDSARLQSAILDQRDTEAMKIDRDGNMELSAEENQDLMDQLGIAPRDYDDPPIEIESLGVENGAATFKATNLKTGKTIEMVFDALDEGGDPAG